MLLKAFSKSGFMSILSSRIYEFDSFCLNTTESLLLRNGQLIPLTMKAYKTLLVLVERNGHIVSKDDLIKKVWPDTFIEEATLTQNIFTLRKVLGKTPDGRSYIETIPKRGYRLAVPVNEVNNDNVMQVVADDLATWASEKGRTDISDSIRDSIAVLPFTNLCDNPAAAYLSEGIHESIINSISDHSQLNVIAHKIVSRYKGQEIDPQEIGYNLGLRSVLVGRVLQFNDRFLIRVELIDVVSGWQLWGAQYDWESSDVFATQEKISKYIVDALESKLLRIGSKSSRKDHFDPETLSE
jgi:DNA-binding winged helix-turn-helix (wHTH) protein